MNELSECDVLIVGAGPVGLLLANLLAARGVSTVIVEKRTDPPAGSMAIGVTPPSLEILRRIDLDQEFVRAGQPITRAHVHENRECIGTLDFSGLACDYPFFLSIPQARTQELLGRRLAGFRQVAYRENYEFTGLEIHPHGVTAELTATGTTNVPGNVFKIRARYLIGCDGHRSVVRRAAGLAARERYYKPRFIMADFEDTSGLGEEAHLYFGRRTSIESFPLPEGQRRWIVMTPGHPPADIANSIIHEVQAATGHDLAGSPVYWASQFTTKWLLAERYYRDRVLLAGDAAHVMSPIGGQGMNTGFADAEFLAEILPEVLVAPERASACFGAYEQIRRRAFQVAANRAGRGMWLGTRRGVVFSELRKRLIRDVLFHPLMTPRLAPYFAMLTIPGNTYARTRRATPGMERKSGPTSMPHAAHPS